jgi:hypothetical protein
MRIIKTTVEQIRALETYRENLLLKIEELKKMADAKATALEREISMLKDEAKELCLLLSADDVDREKRK